MWERWRGVLTMQALLVAMCWWLVWWGAHLLDAAPVSAPPAQLPPVIGIGGLLAFNSTIGRAAKAALELAVSDLNNSSLLGNATQLVLHLGNTNCSAFQGAAAGTFLILHRHTRPHQTLFQNLINSKRIMIFGTSFRD